MGGNIKPRGQTEREAVPRGSLSQSKSVSDVTKEDNVRDNSGTQGSKSKKRSVQASRDGIIRGREKGSPGGPAVGEKVIVVVTGMSEASPAWEQTRPC